MNNQKTSNTNRTRTNFIIDVAAFIAFLIAFAPYETGISLHEWLGIAVGGVIIVHLLLHWDWIVKTVQHFLHGMARRQRINAILDALLFIDTIVIIFTGLMISEEILPALGLTIPYTPAYSMVHSFSANFAMLIIGLHVALHWKWIIKAFQRFAIDRLRRKKALGSGVTSQQESKA